MAMNTIVLISDDNYVLPTVVMIESIVDNYNREKDLQIYVMSWISAALWTMWQAVTVTWAT